jgi:DNA replication protein DnaC
MNTLKSIIDQEKKKTEEMKSTAGRVVFDPEKLDFEQFKTLVITKMRQRTIAQSEGDKIGNVEYTSIVINGNTLKHASTNYLVREFYQYLTGGESNLHLNKGMLVSGSIGVGKTLLLVGLTQAINAISRKKILHLHANELPDFIKDEKFNTLYKKPLYIEDIGRELKEYNHYGTVYNPFYDLMMIRYKHGSWTFGCSNLKLESMQELYGRFIASRMQSMFNIIYLTGESKRK